MYKIALCVFGILMAASSVEANTVTYGRPPSINLGNGGSGGLNQLIATTSFTVVNSGQVTKWEAFNAGATPGIVASVIFTPDTSNPGNYLVTGMDYQTLQLGYNEFLNPTYASSLAGLGSGGSNSIVAGTIFGLYHVTAKVSNANAGAVDLWGRDLDFLTNLPPDGTSLTITPFGITGSGGTAVPRTYSYLVTTSEIPAPSTLWLVGAAMVGWKATRRKAELAA